MRPRIFYTISSLILAILFFTIIEVSAINLEILQSELNFLPLIFNQQKPTPVPTQTPEPITPGKLLLHFADESIVYNWFTYVPKNLNKSKPTYIWISGLHGNLVTDDYNQITEESRSQAEGRTWLADDHQYILLVPVIPRPQTDYVYVVAFSWKVFLESTPHFLQRPDEKINLMIDKFTFDLRSDGYFIQDKVFIDGYSAGAMFSQRYTLLHPDRVQAAAAGQCGGAMTLPESIYNETILEWPVGVSDLNILAGFNFDKTSFVQVPQFIYIGDKDDTNSTLRGTGELWRTQSQIDFLNNTFGNTDPIRLENQVNYLNNLGYTNILFKMYPGIGHQIIPEMVNDTMAFFNAYK